MNGLIKGIACLRLGSRISRVSILRCNSSVTASNASAEGMSIPPPSGSPAIFTPKIQSLVDEIAKLNLIEVADLNECLKKTLKIEGVAMTMGGGGFAAPAASASAEDEGDDGPAQVKTSFTVKLTKIDDKQKIAIIKEIKTIVEGMNLVQAKKFVESLPQNLKTNVPKDEAEKVKAALEKIGATIEIE